MDQPHVDLQNPAPSPLPWSPKGWAPHAGATGDYTTIPYSFCEDNLDISNLADMPMEGHMRSPTVHLCYNKCIAQDCEGDDCFCDGAYTGYDTATSNALCADEDLCKHICDTYEECKSIDMSTELPRCFLNMDKCDGTDTAPALPTADPHYHLLMKVIDQ